MLPLTAKQAEILAFITKSFHERGCSPSFDEIRTRFGFASPNAVTKHLQALAKKGYLRGRQGARPRQHCAITPVQTHENGIPVLGTIAAGMPIEAIENIDNKVDLSSLGLENSRHDLFILRVKGDSMIEAHILNGDLVIVKQQQNVNANEIAAVLWNGEATLKYVRKAEGHFILKPANAAMEPIMVRPHETESFQVLGKYIGLIRK